jgi:dTDP-4-dehydrorhamnose reductase
LLLHGILSKRAGRARRDRPLELWGGYECTVNRVGDIAGTTRRRAAATTSDRIDDLALFAGVGMRSLRYPALWERMSPDDGATRDFRWTDERLPELRRLGSTPSSRCATTAAARLHQPGRGQLRARPGRACRGRGPRYPVGARLDAGQRAADHGALLALYGFWYPHTTDERLFWLALLNEIDATRLAMREIRKVNPQARLVQTDDLGYCHATPPLQSARPTSRTSAAGWGWDLLCGMVVPGHALWDRLCNFGFEDRLRAIADDPCPPDIIGINHYLSSERFMDHRSSCTRTARRPTAT